jgi:GTP-binding protein EngB required for normal cell division
MTPDSSAWVRCMFNENQQRYVISRLHSIDQMLGEAADQLEPTDRGRIFTTVSPDATPEQRKVLGDYLAQVRFALRRFMLTQQLHEERRPRSGLWSFRTTLEFARIAAEELRPRYWRGYGAVHPESAAAAERFAAELATLLRRIEDYLVRGEGGSLATRLSRLAGEQEELKLLRELERIISSYGFTELRAPLEILVDRAASPRFEIAVFGRVSAGKSSLLNWWLNRALLPTGITPVTTVPTRIIQGDRPRIRIKTVSGALDVALEHLDEYVTEAGNPANSKQILDILIQVPAERLRGGVCLVDTPGLGSLATAGAVQTLEYLPRCDLGILLLAAGAPLTLEDIDVARALVDSGCDLTVAVSKADQLSNVELEQALAYVRDQFQSALGVAPPIRPVSTLPSHEALALEWFERELAPRLAQHHTGAARVLRRKISVLRESVIAVLTARLASPSEYRTDSQPAIPVQESIAQVRSDFEQVRSELLDLRLRLPAFAAHIVDAAATELARCWAEAARGDYAIGERVDKAIAHRADEAGHAVAQLLIALRDAIVRVLEQCGAEQEAVEELARPRGRPIFDLASLPKLRRYDRPLWLPRVPLLLRTLARARARDMILTPVEDQLGRHGEALCHWGMRYLDDLERKFDAGAALREGAERFESDGSWAADKANAARRDVELLRAWPAEAVRTLSRGS